MKNAGVKISGRHRNTRSLAANYVPRMVDGHYVVTYSCMCHAYVAAGMINVATAALVWCQKHRRGVSVYAIVESWWYNCRTCHCVRDYGVAPVTALRKASAHADRYAGHIVAILHGKEVDEVIQRQTAYPGDLATQPLPVQLALPLEDPTDPPPY